MSWDSQDLKDCGFFSRETAKTPSTPRGTAKTEIDFPVDRLSHLANTIRTHRQTSANSSQAGTLTVPGLRMNGADGPGNARAFPADFGIYEMVWDLCPLWMVGLGLS